MGRKNELGWVGAFVIVGIAVVAEETMAITAGGASLYWDASLTSATIFSADSRFVTEYHGAPSMRTNPGGSLDFSTTIPFTNGGFHELAQIYRDQTFAAWLAGSMTIRTEPLFLPPAMPEGAMQSFATPFRMTGTISAYASSDRSGTPLFTTNLTGSGLYRAGPYRAISGTWVRAHTGADSMAFASGAPATNLALNKPAVASSSFDANFTPNRAVDGDPSTRWSSEFASPEWIAVDLGRFLQIDRIVLNWEDAFASQYLVMLSDARLASTSSTSHAFNWRATSVYSGRFEPRRMVTPYGKRTAARPLTRSA